MHCLSNHINNPFAPSGSFSWAQIAHTGKDENPIQTQDISMLELARRSAFLMVMADRELKQEANHAEH
jgi:hypothetical protein